jgi:hypothetical protein
MAEEADLATAALGEYQVDPPVAVYTPGKCCSAASSGRSTKRSRTISPKVKPSAAPTRG